MQAPDVLPPSNGALPAANGGTQDMSSLSPVCRMPTDVMANIFEHCVNEYDYPHIGTKWQAPTSLSQVCQSWRKLSFALPCLWMRFQVHVDSPTHTSNWERLVQSKIMSIRLWLSRSQSLPLSLYLCYIGSHAMIPLPALELLDQEILKASSRIRELSLHFPTRSICHLLSFTQGSLESLQYLRLWSAYDFESSDNKPLVLQSAPSLRSLCVSRCHLDMRNFQVPWAQLTELSLLCDFTIDWEQTHSDYLPVLAQCPNLRTCSLALGWSLDDDVPVTTVTLPHLSTLRTEIYAWAPYVMWFFDALHLPKLRSFTIGNLSLESSLFSDGTGCLQMLSRAAETVESVSFSHIDIPDIELCDCLSQLPHLKSLWFFPSSQGLNHNLVATLTIADPQSFWGEPGDEIPHRLICPSLETLGLCCSEIVPIDAVVALVTSRCQFEPQLKHFSLQLERPAAFGGDDDRREEMIGILEARLSSYVDGGLQLTLTK